MIAAASRPAGAVAVIALREIARFIIRANRTVYCGVLAQPAMLITVRWRASWVWKKATSQDSSGAQGSGNFFGRLPARDGGTDGWGPNQP